jgi:hypothetical protein
VLPYLYCLRGDRDLKKAPQGSPLLQAVWQQLQEGPKTVAELVIGVGRELTEAAVLRALRELWAKLRVIPVLETATSNEGARWELLQRLFPDAVRQGAGMSQPLAVSAMVSIYLNGAVAATAEEVEDALGPLASRSRVREVLNALQATRQLTMLPVGRSSAYALAGGGASVLAEVAEKRDTDALKKARVEAKAASAGRSPREFGERKAWAKDKGIAARTRPRAVPRSDGEPVGDGTVSKRPFTGERKEWKPRPAGAGFAARKPFAKREGAGEKREWKPRDPGTGFAARGSSPQSRERKPWVKREGGDRPARPSGERKEWKPRAAGAGFPARKPYVKREGGDYPARKPWVKREGGDRPPRPAGERKEWKPRAAGAGFPARKPYVKREAGNYPPRAARPERPSGERRVWKDRPAPSAAGSGGASTGERKPWVKREGGAEGKSFARKPFGAKPFARKPGGKSFGGKPAGPKAWDKRSTGADAKKAGAARKRKEDEA